MEEDLISKKELLDLTGISYGQLYRWKRKQLIPEEWFIRKSTFTGQETFFPREKMLARLEKIKHLKDDVSLDELAGLFSPNPVDVRLTGEELVTRGIASAMTVDFFRQQRGGGDAFTFDQLLYLYVLEQLFRSGEITRDEGAMLLRTLLEHYPRFDGANCTLISVRKLGVATSCLVTAPADIYFEPDTRIIARVDLGACREELKLKLC